MTRETSMALAVRDALHDAVARVVAGGDSETVGLGSIAAGRTAGEAGPHIDRGVYLATWGRPVQATVYAGAGVCVVLRRAS